MKKMFYTRHFLCAPYIVVITPDMRVKHNGRTVIDVIDVRKVEEF